MGIPDHLTCLLRHLYAGQELLEPDVEQRTASILAKEYVKAVYCHPAYLLICRIHRAKCWLDEAQEGIKISGRNINNLRYADDTTLTAESEEELRSLLMKVKEETEKTGLKSTFKKQRLWHPVPSGHDK